MPITFNCPGCAKTLRVGDENAGKLARCPDCGAVTTIPAASPEGQPPSPEPTSAPAPTPASAPTPLSSSGYAPSEPAPSPSPVSTDSHPSLKETALHPGSNSGVNPASWMMRTENGRMYGPVSKTTLDDWYHQGRIASYHFISSDQGQSWLAAPDVYPQLKQTSAGFQPTAAPQKFSDNPFADAPSGGPYSAYSAPRSAMGPIGGLPAGQGGLLLTLSLFGLFCCPVFSLVSLILGIRELSEVNSGRIRQDAKGMAIASIVISSIGLLSWGGITGLNFLSNMR